MRKAASTSWICAKWRSQEPSRFVSMRTSGSIIAAPVMYSASRPSSMSTMRQNGQTFLRFKQFIDWNGADIFSHTLTSPLTCGCAGHNAHAPSRRRAVCVGRRVTRDAACGASAARKAVRPVGSLAQPCTCGGQFARLRRAIRARAACRRRVIQSGKCITRDAACGASAARKAVRPVGSLAHPCTHAACSGCVPAPGFCFPGLKLGLCFLRPAHGLCLCLGPAMRSFFILSNGRRLVKRRLPLQTVQLFLFT